MKIGHNLNKVYILLKKFLGKKEIQKRWKLKFKINQILQLNKKMIMKYGANLIIILVTKIGKSLK